MGDWLGYLQTAAKAKTGISSGVVIGGIIAAVGAVATVVWLSITLFIWLAERFDNLTLAGLVLSGIYLLITLIAAITAVTVRRLNHRRAEVELQARKAAFTSSLLTGGIGPVHAVGRAGDRPHDRVAASCRHGGGWRFSPPAWCASGRPDRPPKSRRRSSARAIGLRPARGPVVERHRGRWPMPAGRAASRPSSVRPAPGARQISTPAESSR